MPCIEGSGSLRSKASSAYGSSSTIITSRCAHTSTSSRRRSSGMVTPVGFWKLGMAYTNGTRLPWTASSSSARATASGRIPS